MKLYKFNNLIGKDIIVELKIDYETVYLGTWSDKPQTLDGYLVTNITPDVYVLVLELER